MSGIFDALFGALSERGAKEGGRPRPPIGAERPPSTQVSRTQSQPHTAPSTPRLSNKARPIDPETEPLLTRPADTDPLLIDTPPSVPAVPANTVERVSEADNSFSTLADMSLESTQAEIQICPQPTPFVYHRRTQSHLQASASAEDLQVQNNRFRQISSPALTEAHPTSFIPSSTAKGTKKAEAAPESAATDDRYQTSSNWRKEQLDNMKPARLANEGRMKVLSSFHGPLSLPYARNPSGVDATVPNNSTYHSNTFGLRSVPRHNNDTDRVASGATNTTRSSSGSNLVYLPSRPQRASDSDSGHHSVLMIRDPYQKIGVTPGALAVDKYGRHEIAHHAQGPVRQGPNTTTAASTQKALGRRALGVAAMPAASDDTETNSHQDAVMTLIELALAQVIDNDGKLSSKHDENTIARLLSTARYFGVDPRKVSSSSSGSSRAPSLETSSSMSSLLSKVPQTPQQLANFHHSKADHSHNWRSKNRQSASEENVTPARSTVGSSTSPPGPVMTVEELIAKFSPDAKGKSDEKPVTHTAPSSVADDSVDEPKPSNKSKVTVKVKAPLGEASTNRSPTASPKPTERKRSTGAKGTPGAGKLLKKQYVPEVTSAPVPRTSKSSGKLVPIAEQASDVTKAK